MGGFGADGGREGYPLGFADGNRGESAQALAETHDPVEWDSAYPETGSVSDGM